MDGLEQLEEEDILIGCCGAQWKHYIFESKFLIESCDLSRIDEIYGSYPAFENHFVSVYDSGFEVYLNLNKNINKVNTNQLILLILQVLHQHRPL